jgi:predicted alpha/beta superfamily hydrolase
MKKSDAYTEGSLFFHNTNQNMDFLNIFPFNIPQLDRNRTIRVLLPKDYESSNRSYPVLYMQDGQNLFDPETAFGGRDWQIPSTLFKQPLRRQAIIVGIDNGDENRLNEYAPYRNKTQGAGGEADMYCQFIIGTLKPFIDDNYRTLPDRDNTGIAGSSMGGLCAYYAGLTYGNIFGKVGVLSPSIWFNPSVVDLAQNTPSVKSRFFVSGSKTEMKSMEKTLQDIYYAFKNGGFSEGQIQVAVRDRGKHNEIFWTSEFKKMFEYLF